MRYVRKAVVRTADNGGRLGLALPCLAVTSACRPLPKLLGGLTPQ